MSITKIKAPEGPPVSSVCAQRAHTFCTLTSEECGCSECHMTCKHCFSETRKLVGDSSCLACHNARTCGVKPAGTECFVCKDTTAPVWTDRRISLLEPLCASDHRRYWIQHT